MLRSRMLVFLLVLIPGFVVTSCAERRWHAPEADELLSRRPDREAVDSGPVRPHPAAGFGEFDGGGWRAAQLDPMPEPLAWAERKSATLVIPAAVPRDRTVTLRMCHYPLARSQSRIRRPIRVEVRLNGRVLGTLPISEEPRDYEVDARASAWRAGANQLELEVSRASRASDEGTGGWVGVGLAHVDFGEVHGVQVDLDRAQVVLDALTAVSYQVEPERGRRLEVSGRADGAGQLLIRLAEVERVGGVALELPDQPVPVAVSSGSRFDELVELPGPLEGRLEITFEWRPDEGDARLTLDRASLPLAEGREFPPVIFISIDTLAARHLSTYGYPRETSPNIDRFASEAVVFERCRANAPWTRPSYQAQFSGLYPESHERPSIGAGWVPPEERAMLNSERWTLPEALRSVGYRTAGWIDNPWLGVGQEFEQGFDHYDRSASLTSHWASNEPSATKGAWHILEQFEAWLKRDSGERPLFAFLQILDTHAPYLTNAPWAGRFQGDEMFDAEHRAPVAHFGDVLGHIPNHVAWGAVDGDELPASLPTAPLVASYDEKILEVDSALGQLFEVLDDYELYERAIIVLSADHGESMLEHGFYFAHGTLHEEALGVPLIVRLPGGRSGGLRVDTGVQLVDLYPTLLDLLGIPGGAGVHGRSLAPALERGELGPAPLYAKGDLLSQVTVEYDGWKLIERRPGFVANRTLLSHPVMPADVRQEVFAMIAQGAAREEIAKWIDERPELRASLRALLDDVPVELYDLASDPRELENVAEQHPERVATLQALLVAEELRAHGERREFSGFEVETGLSGSTREQLEKLGYLGGE